MSTTNACRNMSASNNSEPLVGLTKYELWVHLVVFYGFICGVVSSVCSILIWVGILRSKKLRNRFFIIVGCLTFCRTGVGLQFMVMAIYRSLRTLEIASACQLRFVCHCIHFWLISGSTVEIGLLFILVVDRVIAVVRSNYYRYLTRKSAFQICVGVYAGVTLLKLITSYISADMLEVVPCVNLYSSAGEEFNAFSQDVDIIMVGVILILYFSLLIYVQRRVKSMRERQTRIGAATDASNMTLQRQLKLMPLLRNLVLMHCSLALTAKLLLTLGVVVPEQYAQRFTAYGGIMTCIDVCANVTMLLFTNADIRAASLPCLAKRTAKVRGLVSPAKPDDTRKRSTLTVASARPGTVTQSPVIH